MDKDTMVLAISKAQLSKFSGIISFVIRLTKRRALVHQCDESFRYIKQSYNLEDIRVRSYKAIRNLIVLVLAVSYFAAVYLGQNLKLKILVERIFLVSKRFFGVPSFFNYAIL